MSGPDWMLTPDRTRSRQRAGGIFPYQETGNRHRVAAIVGATKMGYSNTNLGHQAQIAVDDFGAVPFDSGITDVHAMALALTTVNLFQRWRLDDAEARAILGGMAKPVWARWKKGRIGPPGLIDDELRDRMALLMCIHWAVRTLFVDPEYGYAWIRNPIKSLNGESVLDCMMKGDVASIEKIRDWLYMECQLW